MQDTLNILQLFPENGLDRSLHAPVFIGLLLLAFFRETLGWSFAGLVVPGYLATVLVAAPVTGALVVAESILAYVLALTLGRKLPRAGAWFTFFGRERFLLLIACAALIRLAVEASLIPSLVQRWDLTHSRELYSLGLVLVPLLANSFWNSGFIRAFPRIGLVTALTYWIVAEVLLPHTNFTLSRFQVANESVSLAFLESPHAHIILLVGAIVAARNNVRYGWDYNGILVPALLAVAWYQPSKVATTLGEALVVYIACMGLIRLPPFSRMMIVGSRRVVLTFSVGFAIKYACGVALFRWLPHIQMVDFFGFGYLLPSLLANKMWDRGTVAGVLMPTIQVSIVSFPIGAAVGFGLRLLELGGLQEAEAAAVAESRSLSASLVLAETAPAPERSGVGRAIVDSYEIALELVAKGQGERVSLDQRRLATRGRLRLELEPDAGWLIVAPDASNPNADPTGPRFAVGTKPHYGKSWLLVVDAPQVGSPLPILSEPLAAQIGARAIVLRSRFPASAGRDLSFAYSLSQQLGLKHMLWLAPTDGDVATPRLSLVGKLPDGIDPVSLETVVGRSLEVRWRGTHAGGNPVQNAPRLEIPQATAEAAALAHLAVGAPPVWVVPSRGELLTQLRALTHSAPSSFLLPSRQELRLYGHLVKGLVEETGSASGWPRALAKLLGLQIAKVEGHFEGWALFEAEGAARRGSPTLLLRAASRARPHAEGLHSTPAAAAAASSSPAASSSAVSSDAAASTTAPPVLPSTPGGVSAAEPSPRLLLTLAAPRWQKYGIEAATRLSDGFRADALLVHGTSVHTQPDGTSDPRFPRGRHMFFQRAHEVWLNSGGASVSLRGLSADRTLHTEIVAAFDGEVAGPFAGPPWTRPLLRSLRQAGVHLSAVDGTAERTGLEASRDPGVAYARRFAANRSMVLWLGEGIRQIWNRSYTDPITIRRLEQSGWPLHRMSPQHFVQKQTHCPATHNVASQASPRSFCVLPKGPPESCNLPIIEEWLVDYTRTQNPYFLRSVLEHGKECAYHIVHDAQRELAWLVRHTSSAQHDRSDVTLIPLVHSPSIEALKPSVEPVRAEQLSSLQSLGASPLRVQLP